MKLSSSASCLSPPCSCSVSTAGRPPFPLPEHCHLAAKSTNKEHIITISRCFDSDDRTDNAYIDGRSEIQTLDKIVWMERQIYVSSRPYMIVTSKHTHIHTN